MSVAEQLLFPSKTDLKAAFELVKKAGLPKIPEIVIQLREEINKLEFNPERVVELISQDPFLTGQVIKLVNSPLYARSTSIDDIKHATMILGVKRVGQLVTAESISKLTEQKNKSIRAVWESVSKTARAAMAVSKTVPEISSEEAYLLGMMHDIGGIVFASLRENYASAWQQLSTVPVTMLEKEKKAFGVDHTTIGFLLASHWELPNEYALAIYHHHSEVCDYLPDSKVRTMVAILKLANYLVVDSTAINKTKQMERYRRAAQNELMLSDEQWGNIKSDAFWN